MFQRPGGDESAHSCETPLRIVMIDMDGHDRLNPQLNRDAERILVNLPRDVVTGVERDWSGHVARRSVWSASWGVRVIRGCESRATKASS